MMRKRVHQGACFIRPYIYCVAGVSPGDGFECTNAVERYHIKNCKWEELTSKYPTRSHQITLLPVGGRNIFGFGETS